MVFVGQQLQQDPNDPTKWQVVTTGAPQGTQLVTVASSASNSGQQLSSPAQADGGGGMEVLQTFLWLIKKKKKVCFNQNFGFSGLDY